MGDSDKDGDGGIVRRLSLVGEYEGLVKRFEGFDKSRHTAPKFASDRAQQFLARLAEPELVEWGEALFASYRESMEYRRKDIALDVGAGAARLESKDFVLERRYSLLEDRPDCYRVETELLNASGVELLCHEPFNQSTGPLFERMRCVFGRRVSVEGVIDGLEDADENGVTVDYPSSYDFCDARIDGLDAVFRFESMTLEIRFPSLGMPKQLIEAYRAMAKELASVEVVNELVRII